MTVEAQLRGKLRKIEALFAGTGTPGERHAAEAALDRIRARLTELERGAPAIELQFPMPDPWPRHLLLALCRRYGLRPFRYRRQHLTTVMVRVPRGFVDQVLWPEFLELNEALTTYLNEVTLRVIREEVYADASEAAEVATALPPAADRQIAEAMAPKTPPRASAHPHAHVEASASPDACVAIRRGIIRQGGSLAVRLPATFARAVGLAERSAVDIVLDNGRIVLSPADTQYP